MVLEAILFDAGNTLLELDYPFISERFKRVGISRTSEEVREAEIRARVRMDPFLAEQQATEASRVFRRYMEMVTEGLGLPWNGAVEEVFGDLCRANSERGLWRRAAPGAADTLATLRGKGIILGVVSNSDGRIADHLEAAGLVGFLQVIVDSGMVGVEKPDPRIFRMALREAGVEASRAVYVGDYYSVDVLGARRAGLEALLLDPLGVWPDLDCPKVKDLGAVVEFALADGAPHDGEFSRRGRPRRTEGTGR